MSVPTEFDFALLKIGDGASPEVFTISCGKEDITTNFAANSTDRFRRDCTKPGEVPFRVPKVTGKQASVAASGLTDATTFGTEIDLLGTKPNIKVEYYTDDGTDAGVLLGTLAMNALVTAMSIGAPRNSDSTASINLESNGEWTWTAA